MSLEDDLLGAIEAAELRSLQWGYVDGLLDETDIDGLAARAVGEAGGQHDPVELVETLISDQLLFEYPADGAVGYRSRFAETVRLLAQLRQLMRDKPWATAPKLVSDYRVESGSRLFPRRWIQAEDFVDDLRQRDLLSGLQGDLARAMLSRKGSPLALSDFQSRVVEWALRSDPEDRGCVVTAGTGSGKTLAFYLPVVLQAAAALSATRWTQCLSIYPRRELLKDQFSEVFRLLRSADSVLRAAGVRPITAGALFREAPHSATDEAVRSAGWTRAGVGYVCPFLRCPACESDLIWTNAALSAREESLTCASSKCSMTTSKDQVPLTRTSITGTPPDFVFTTTETLHQRLSDPAYWGALGVPGRRGPAARWALLDEVHTYSGSVGAQVAYTVRRWRHAAGRQARLVGLSATLLEAEQFFADLTGLPLGSVREIGPLPAELEPLGAAYQLILRGDPASRTSLLSTSIQASLLLPRMLDPLGSSSRELQGRLGGRAFVFTDDLDVTNRLFDDIRDAEAYDIFGRPDPGRLPLAELRASNRPDSSARALMGQRWDASEKIGHVLSRRLGVSRTTSRDAGVASGTELVVATSSLEVGFNDPLVGGVIQHKGPLSLAAFLQRKGRAGRTTTMRPWMITVLSDYGRDRVVFRNYEQLFDPVLPPQRLPLQNRHVIAIQGAFAFIDWLARKAPPEVRRWLWWPLNGPTDDEQRRRQQRWILETVKSLAPAHADDADGLAKHLSDSLGIDNAEVDALLWRQPRPLMTTLLPTIQRRLSTEWTAVGPDGSAITDLYSDGPTPHPFPDFLPASLFSDLNLPEVIIEIPPATRNDAGWTDSMAIAQALDVLAPGRVTRRFAHARGKLNHWIPVPLGAAEYRMPLADFADEAEPIGDEPSAAGDGSSVRCYRPWKVRLRQAPGNVNASSNSTLEWRSRLTPGESPVDLPLPARGSWPSIVLSSQVYLHSQHTAVQVRRIAEKANARLRIRGEVDDQRVQVSFVDGDGSPAALGFEHEVDGLRVRIALPTRERALELAQDPALRGSLVRHYFADCLLGDEFLTALGNYFLLDWLQQIYFAALIQTCAVRHVSALDAADALEREGALEPCRRVMADMFRFISTTEEDHGDLEFAPSADQTTDRLAASLEDLLQQPGVVERLTAAARHVFGSQGDEFADWIRHRVASATGDAIAGACAALAPGRSAAEELLLDITSDQTPARATADVWITERAAGGTGTLQAVAAVWATDPMSFARALDATSAPSDLEVAAIGLGRTLDLLTSDEEVAASAARMRAAIRHQDRSSAQAEFFSLLSQRGVAIDRTLSNGLNQRLLRRGVPPDFDALLVDLRSYWWELEARIGTAVDLRTFVYVASTDAVLGPRLTRLVSSITGHAPTTGETVGVLVGVLWAPEWEVRARRERGVRYYNPGLVDLGLVRVYARPVPRIVEFGDVAWRRLLLEALSEAGEVSLHADTERAQEVHSALTELLATPVDVGFLQFYPSIDAVGQLQDGLSVQLVIRELG